MNIKDKINIFLRKKGYEINKIRSSSFLLTNVFKTNFQKKILISYLTSPFTSGINLSHTNLTECYTAAEIFKDLGYQVDVVDHYNSSNIDFSQYDVIYGQGDVFEKSFLADNSEKIKKIFYGTGNNPFFYYLQAGRKLEQFKRVNGKFLPESCRLTGQSSSLSTTNSDAIICLGNSFGKKTYTDITPYLPIYNLNAFYFDVLKDQPIIRDIKLARNHFLWFGSAGLITKGLGDCIDFFSKNPKLTLHICGATKNERRFWEFYEPILKESSNIINHGFVNLNSEKFFEIISTCTFAIFPSVSEGGSPSLLNLMANGALIPIATKACSVDIENFGYVLDDSSVKSIENIINQIAAVDDAELLEKSITTQKNIKENYTLDIYKNNLRAHIKSCLNL